VLSVERSNGNYMLIRANGWLSSDDYGRFENQFAEQLERWKSPFPLLLDMRGFRGWTPSGFLRDLLWDLRNRKTFSMIAVIGDARWHKWITAAGAMLFHGQSKYFQGTDAHFAEQWLR
jgi:hypothetical protein